MDILERVALWNEWWGGKISRQLVGEKRFITSKLLKWADEKEVKVITGPRRAGKTTVLYQIIDVLLRRGVDPKNILLINFQDPVLRDVDPHKIYLSYIQEQNPTRKIYVFLDEAQESTRWASWVKTMYDARKDISFFVSGSNAKLLRDDYSHYLSGRTVKFDVFPLNFREFLHFKGVRSPITEEKEARIFHYYKEYITYGGFPEVFYKPQPLKLELLQNYAEDFIIHDLVKRYNVRRDKIETLLRWLLTNAGSPISYARLERMIGLSGETIERYVQMLKDTYLIIEANFFSPSLKKQYMSPKKFYPIDLGLESVYAFTYRDEGGKKLENAVAVELNSITKPLYYYRNDFEVDFIVNLNGWTAIHVTHDASLPREKRAIRRASRDLRIKNNILVGLNGKHSFWKFCLKTLPSAVGSL